MLKYYVRQSATEAFQEVSKPPRQGVWIHGDNVAEHELVELADSYGFDLNLIRDVLDINELARVETKSRGKELYVFIRTAHRTKRGVVVTTPILLAAKDAVFINLSMANTEHHRLARPSVIAQASDTTSLLLGTFAAVVQEYEGFMQHTSRYVYDTEQRLRIHEVTNDDFIRFVTVENNLNEYRTHLSGMQAVAERLQELMSDEGDKEAVEDIELYIKQLLVGIASLKQSITSIRNTYGMIANNSLNQRIKALTVLMALIALPGVFFGMYGMNVALPFQHEPWAYPVISSISILVTLGVFLFAKKKGIF
jgi:magnesium transporter